MSKRIVNSIVKLHEATFSQSHTQCSQTNNLKSECWEQTSHTQLFSCRLLINIWVVLHPPRNKFKLQTGTQWTFVYVSFPILLYSVSEKNEQKMHTKHNNLQTTQGEIFIAPGEYHGFKTIYRLGAISNSYALCCNPCVVLYSVRIISRKIKEEVRSFGISDNFFCKVLISCERKEVLVEYCIICVGRRSYRTPPTLVKTKEWKCDGYNVILKFKKKAKSTKQMWKMNLEKLQTNKTGKGEEEI